MDRPIPLVRPYAIPLVRLASYRPPGSELEIELELPSDGPPVRRSEPSVIVDPALFEEARRFRGRAGARRGTSSPLHDAY